MSKSKFLVIEQTIKKPDGWTDEDVNIFVDNYLNLIDTYGKDFLTVAGCYTIKTEKELEDESKS